MNVDNIPSSTAFVLSHFNITIDELNTLSTFLMMGGEDVLAEKINKLIQSLSSSMVVEENFEEKQLQLSLQKHRSVEIVTEENS
jgi:uncharacterized membrane protein YhfC